MGFRGMSPKQMERMMKKMGIEQKDLEGVKEVVIRFADKEWVISNPQVTMVKQANTETYQVAGSKTEHALSGKRRVETPEAAERNIPEKKMDIPIEDAALVASQTGVDIETAKKTLIETDGDLAAAILKLRH
jgi:nascent polypeptide-associated complex subunit alpha